MFDVDISGSILFIYPSPDLSAEDEIVHKIAEMSVKLQHIDTLNDQRKLDLQVRDRSNSCIHVTCFLAGYFSAVQLSAEAGEGSSRSVRRQQLLPEQEVGGVQQAGISSGELHPNIRSQSSIHSNFSPQHSHFSQLLHARLQDLQEQSSRVCSNR